MPDLPKLSSYYTNKNKAELVLIEKIRVKPISVCQNFDSDEARAIITTYRAMSLTLTIFVILLLLTSLCGFVLCLYILYRKLVL